MDGRRRRGDKLNSIVFLDGIGHFEEDDDGDFGSKGEERQKGPFLRLSFLLSLPSSNFQVDI